MGQSLVKNYVHIVFSTKHRQPFISKEIEKELFAYLAGMCMNRESIPIIVGGYLDHVHILCALSKKIALMKLVEVVKSHSSKWIKTKGEDLANFYWQDGYAAFSVNPGQVDRVIQYIANQRQHHEKRNFQNELRVIFKRYKMEYDEAYIWD
ncbi:MAG: IS200/IS605 family transposase [Bacteroidetes bacterium]|nr:IS200/IS605 family transposase [Bacteroidota bacterium]